MYFNYMLFNTLSKHILDVLLIALTECGNSLYSHPHCTCSKLHKLIKLDNSDTSRGERTNFFKSLLIANPLISKVRQSANRKSTNFYYKKIRKSQIRKFLQNTAKLCFETVLKVAIYSFFIMKKF
jgi:hypothetical protein